METKRFIGNDMPRIYARVKREFGPDAVIVRTRSLLREGAEPLIEVLAAPPEAEAELSFELQKAMIDGALAHVQGTAGGVTVGELEDLVSRERELDERMRRQGAPPAPSVASAEAAAHRSRTTETAPELAADAAIGYTDEFHVAPPAPVDDVADDQAARPAWTESDTEIGAARPHLDDAPLRRLPMPEITTVPAPENDWASRPRPTIITRPRRAEPVEPVESVEPSWPEPPAPIRRLRAEAAGGVAARLAEAGLSFGAARMVEASAPAGASAEEALGALLESRVVRYPDEHRTAIISIQGAAGAGRTTALMRMALDCADSGRHTILLAADGSHVAGRDEVHAYAEAIGLRAVDAFDAGEIVRTAGLAPKGSCLFVDAPAGAWQAPPMPGVDHFQYLAVPAHWQADAMAAAAEEMSLASFAGAVLTFTDVATTLSPAISLVVESDLGVAFLSSSRDVGTGIAVAEPVALASGIFTTRTRESTDGRVAATA